MAKRGRIKYRNRFVKRAVSRAKKMTLPIAVIAGLAPGITTTVATVQNSGWQMGGRMLGLLYTGYDATSGKFSLSAMKGGLLPLAVGTMVHKAAGMIGINRAIAAAGIPVLRI